MSAMPADMDEGGGIHNVQTSDPFLGGPMMGAGAFGLAPPGLEQPWSLGNDPVFEPWSSAGALASTRRARTIAAEPAEDCAPVPQPGLEAVLTAGETNDVRSCPSGSAGRLKQAILVSPRVATDPVGLDHGDEAASASAASVSLGSCADAACTQEGWAGTSQNSTMVSDASTGYLGPASLGLHDDSDHLVQPDPASPTASQRKDRKPVLSLSGALADLPYQQPAMGYNFDMTGLDLGALYNHYSDQGQASTAAWAAAMASYTGSWCPEWEHAQSWAALTVAGGSWPSTAYSKEWEDVAATTGRHATTQQQEVQPQGEPLGDSFFSTDIFSSKAPAESPAPPSWNPMTSLSDKLQAWQPHAPAAAADEKSDEKVGKVVELVHTGHSVSVDPSAARRLLGSSSDVEAKGSLEAALKTHKAPPPHALSNKIPPRPVPVAPVAEELDEADRKILEMGLPSVGSAQHETRECKPCAFFHHGRCGNGQRCKFCHLCDEHERKKRRREKFENRKRAIQDGRLVPASHAKEPPN